MSADLQLAIACTGIAWFCLVAIGFLFAPDDFGRLFGAWFGFCLGFSLAATGWIAYVAIHFLAKVW